MKRTEELLLLRAVFEIGRKVSAIPHDDRMSGYDMDDARDLLSSLSPLRQLIDEEDRHAARRRR